MVNIMHICEFQNMMQQLYLPRDYKRRVEGAYKWLANELPELWKALESKVKDAAEEEFVLKLSLGLLY